MSAKLKFARTEVAALVAALPHPTSKLTLAKDDGVYLMSFDVPVPEGQKKRQVVYAKGYNPEKDGEDVWGKSQDAMGGDDGGDDVGTRQEFEAILADSVGDLIINVSATSLSVGYLPKNPAPKVWKPLDVFKGAKTGKWRVVHSVKANVGEPVLYGVAFPKKADAVNFVKTLKTNATFKAMHDGAVARAHKAVA